MKTQVLISFLRKRCILLIAALVAKTKNVPSAEKPSPLPRATLSLRAPSSSAFLLVYEQLDPTVGIELSQGVSILNCTRVMQGSAWSLMWLLSDAQWRSATVLRRIRRCISGRAKGLSNSPTSLPNLEPLLLIVSNIMSELFILSALV